MHESVCRQKLFWSGNLFTVWQCMFEPSLRGMARVVNKNHPFFDMMKIQTYIFWVHAITVEALREICANTRKFRVLLILFLGITARYSWSSVVPQEIMQMGHTLRSR